MCCGGMMSFPNEVGYKIAALTPGTEIIILAGEGSPASDKEKVDIIWQVEGYSALTANGVILTCHNVSDVILTDRHFDKYPVSDEAKKIQAEVDAMLIKEASLFNDDDIIDLQFVDDDEEDPTRKFKSGDWDKFPSEPE